MPLTPDELQYDEKGLITAVAQDHLTGEIRMVGWMNREAVRQTIETGRATFFSRSRQRLWVKGEESGNHLRVVDFVADCDADTLLVLCEPAGPTCHTGRQNCFFRPVTQGPATQDGQSSSDGEVALPFAQRLEAVLEERKASTAEKSYTRSLFEGGAPKIGKKICEEAGEVTEAIASESDDRVAAEAADVVYHLLVGLRFRGLPFRRVLGVLSERFGTGGHVEKAARGG